MSRIFVCALFWAITLLPARADMPVLREIHTTAERGLIPETDRGDWRVQAQLVWDGTSATLRRQRFRLFDPFAEHGFDLFWEPRHPSAEPGPDLTGEGILTWRDPGAFRHSQKGIRAQFIGMMQDGRATGFGRFTNRAGLRYTGQWQDGLMHGTGHLMMPDGDALAGQFLRGEPNGPGQLVHASGATYSGPFTPQAPELAQGFLAEGLRIALSVGGQARFCCGFENQELPYASLSEPGRLAIFPDDPALLDQWRGRSNVVISDPVAFDWARAARWQYSFLNYHDNVNTTVPLRFGLGNATTQPVQIAGAYLDIDRSRVDTQPMMQAVVLLPLSPLNTDFSLENYGWSVASDIRLTARFIRDDAASDSFVVDIPDIDSVGDFSLVPVLQGFGVATDRLGETATTCAGQFGQNQNPAGCVDRIRNSGIFGALAPLLVPNASGSSLGLMVDGTLDYAWQDGDGQPQRTSAPFRGHLPLASLVSRAECEGGDFMQVDGGRPFDLRLTADRYRINLPVSGPVAAGEERRWEVTLDAEQSSNHDMRVVIRLLDGREIVSRDLSALMYNPKHYDASVRPFEPRC